MYNGEDIKSQREAVANQIVKGFSNSDDLLEKAHNHGDVHPNGKWYWESSANGGKGDWRTIKASKTATPKQKSEKKEDSDTTIDQAVYDKVYEKAMSKEETEEHLKSALAKIESGIKQIKDAMDDASDATYGTLKKMLIGSVSKKKAIEDALKTREDGTKKSAKFVPKQTFKNAKDMANKIDMYLAKNVDIQPFVDILGKTVYDKGAGTKYRCINAGSGHYGEWDCSTSSYLQKDGSGDYLEFKDKPSQQKLDKCSKLLKEKLAKEGYDVNPKFIVLDHNSYYQHVETFGVGISIKITKKEVQSSSKTDTAQGKSSAKSSEANKSTASSAKTGDLSSTKINLSVKDFDKVESEDDEYSKNAPLKLHDYIGKSSVEYYDSDGNKRRATPWINEFYASAKQDKVGGYEMRFDRSYPISSHKTLNEAISALNVYINKKRIRPYNQ